MVAILALPNVDIKEGRDYNVVKYCNWIAFNFNVLLLAMIASNVLG